MKELLVVIVLSSPHWNKFEGEAFGMDGGMMFNGTVDSVKTVQATIVDAYPDPDRYNQYVPVASWNVVMWILRDHIRELLEDHSTF